MWQFEYAVYEYTIVQEYKGPPEILAVTTPSLSIYLHSLQDALRETSHGDVETSGQNYSRSEWHFAKMQPSLSGIRILIDTAFVELHS